MAYRATPEQYFIPEEGGAPIRLQPQQVQQVQQQTSSAIDPNLLLFGFGLLALLGLFGLLGYLGSRK